MYFNQYTCDCLVGLHSNPLVERLNCLFNCVHGNWYQTLRHLLTGTVCVESHAFYALVIKNLVATVVTIMNQGIWRIKF